MAKNDGGQAFPSETVLVNGFREVHKGMTRRQWLVGMALMGHMAYTSETKQGNPFIIAKMCFERADAILEFEEKENKKE